MMKHIVRLGTEVGFAETEIDEAWTAEEALAKIREAIPDIAVVDPHLTEDERLEDGIEVIGRLRAVSRDCIIVCLTACGTTDNAMGIRALRAGANDFIDMSWPGVNWYQLLLEKLKIWKGVLERRAK